MIGLFTRFLRLVGLRTLTVLILVILPLLAVGQSIADLVPSLERQLITGIVIVGVLIAWQLARTKASVKVAALLMLVVGFLFVTIFVGQLAGKLELVYVTLVHYQRQYFLESIWTKIDWQPLQIAIIEIATDVTNLYGRVFQWSQSAVEGRKSYDPASASIVWCAALWLVSCWAGWVIKRNKAALPALLPTLVLFSAISAFTGANIASLAGLVLTLLILMVIVGHEAREQTWTKNGIDFSEDIRLDIALLVVPVSITLVSAGWIIPSISLDEITQFVRRIIQEPAAQVQPIPESLGLKPDSKPAKAFEVSRAPGLPRSHLIGSGPELSRDVVMVIRTGEYPPLAQYTGVPFTPPNYYWRASTYDQYSGNGWLTSQTNAVGYQASQPVITDTTLSVRALRQDVIPETDLEGVVYRAGALIASDREIAVEWRDQEHHDEFHSTFRRTTTEYSVDSLVSDVSVEQLQAVPSEYPDWVNQRYMNLPDDLPQRVRTLARNLTAVQPTPYDRAIAIEEYLRTYSYTLDLPEPPYGRDVADYFLFDLKRGYCDYFATTMVVLARAAGLPARLVVGYAPGAYDPMNAQYVVTKSDAHSWPEIYFNEYGWIEFEPTSGRAAIERPTRVAQTASPSRALEPLKPRLTLLDNLIWFIVGTVLILLVCAYPAWLILYSYWLGFKKPDEVMRHIYARLRMQGRRWGVHEMAGDTPYEYLRSMALPVATEKEMSFRNSLHKQVNADVSYLLTLFVRNSYSQKRADHTETWLAITMWKRITLTILLTRFLRALDRRQYPLWDRK